MAGYTIRSLAQLAAEATGAFVQSVQGTATKLWPNVWRVEGKVLALIGFEMEQRRAWLVRQLFASTAERVWLIRHGFEFGLQPEPANTAMGTATAAAAPGAIVPIGLQYARGDGVTYSTVANATARGNSVSIDVHDNGPGVPEKARAHLFQAFQGSARKGGTGLGLAVAHELVAAHGGTIRLMDAESGRGTQFRIEIPDRAG